MRQKNQLVAPVLKWVGGKRQLLASITPLLPTRINSYCEPFVGGGALLFHLQPKKAIVNDINSDLIGVYIAIKNDVEDLIKCLEQFKNESEEFYSVRNWDRDKTKYDSLTSVEKAARIIYLNKTCYNGLFRVNSSGEFNAPFGNYKNPNIVNAPVLRAVNNYLNSIDLEITSGSYIDVLGKIKKGTFVYLDPPYDPVSDSSNFTGYSRGGFDRQDQITLKENCDMLHKKNIKFMLSNSDTDFIREQYSSYNIMVVKAKRAINSNAAKRGAINELIIRNYD